MSFTIEKGRKNFKVELKHYLFQTFYFPLKYLLMIKFLPSPPELQLPEVLLERGLDGGAEDGGGGGKPGRPLLPIVPPPSLRTGGGGGLFYKKK